MHIHYLFHPFKEKLNLPSGSIELKNALIGPGALRKIRDEQRPSYEKKRVRLELLSLLLCFLLPSFTSLCCFFWWKGRTNDTHRILFPFIDAPCIATVRPLFHLFQPLHNIS